VLNSVWGSVLGSRSPCWLLASPQIYGCGLVLPLVCSVSNRCHLSALSFTGGAWFLAARWRWRHFACADRDCGLQIQAFCFSAVLSAVPECGAVPFSADRGMARPWPAIFPRRAFCPGVGLVGWLGRPPSSAGRPVTVATPPVVMSAAPRRTVALAEISGHRR